MGFKISHSADELLERLEPLPVVVEIGRPNVCEGEGGKQWAIAPDQIRELLTDWEGPTGCIATDRILVDGCEVGYMYRERPDEDRPDSGWRFTAGDESDEYMDDPANSEVYQLNTICNYDPDIIPLLDSPYGTAYWRDEDGEFQCEEFDPDEEIDA
ncbi:DUF2185 domain-containing protein [Clostridiales bacterium BX7]|uniref:DUF2185 domain-containing protein n=2 Tax=Feifania hominis TaxID=2763660 RepID=A0A926HSZ0_9FIRM|nr:DUF2185 domain-containing protein [Feifania hominis]